MPGLIPPELIELAVKAGTKDAAKSAAKSAARPAALAAARAAGQPISPELRAVLRARSPLSVDVYHGTRQPDSTAINQFHDRLLKLDVNGEPLPVYGMSTAVGTHVAPDPRVASNRYFTERDVTGVGKDTSITGGHVMPLRMPPVERFKVVPQVRTGADPSVPLTPHTAEPDDGAVDQFIASTLFRQDPERLSDALLQGRHALSGQKANEMASALLNDDFSYGSASDTRMGLTQFMRSQGLYLPSNQRHEGVSTFRDMLRDQGYSGLSYVNTSMPETGRSVTGADVARNMGVEPSKREDWWRALDPSTRNDLLEEHSSHMAQTDPTSYIVFPQVDDTGYYPLRSKFADFDPAFKRSPNLMHARGGRVSAFAVRK